MESFAFVTPGFIYWVTVMAKLRIPFIALSILLAIFFVVVVVTLFIAWLDGEPEGTKAADKEFRKAAAIIGVALSVCILVATLLPSKKEVALMYVIPAVVNGEVVQKDIPAVYNKLMGELLPKDETDKQEEGTDGK